MKTVSRPRWLLVVVALAPAVVLLVAGVDRRWMDDDGFINLRVVRNLLHGDGPVYNLYERVEAVTSPLWVALLALLGCVGVRLEHAAVFTGIALTTMGLLFAQGGAARLHAVPDASFAERLKGSLPVGAAIFAVLPPAWDYASSGLETGLGLAWLGASYLALAAQIRQDAVPSTGVAGGSWCAVLLGVGPLIRPEFVLYAVVPLGILSWDVGVRAGPSPRSRVLAVARIASCALAAPFAYQIFRMGYYAAIVPNTAIAKEAFLANWSQGACYFDNFFGTYKLVVPLSAAAIFWLARLLAHAAARHWSPFAATIAPPIAAAAHVVYVVRLGGDYMHARMFVPAVFAALLPVAMVPLSAPPLPWARAVLGAAGLVICGWLPLCAARLRVNVENVCTIGDERGWHARMAKFDHPVALENYRNHPFYEASRSALQRLAGMCPGLSPGEAASDPGCRAISLDDDEQAKLAPPCANCRMASSVPSRIAAALSGGAIGMLGYVLPSSAHVFDRHGLADPLVARAKIQQRARPGHEKTLPPAWMVARFSDPAAVEDASVTAARHALHCGELAALEHAITGPLTFGLFFDNVAHAVRHDRLRIPSDPFEAESEFCGTPPLPHSSSGGGGGTAFQWRCPPGIAVSGVRGTFKESERVVGTVRAVCGVATSAVIGRAFGEGTDPPFDVACPDDSTAIGLHGRSDNLVRSVGLVCLREGGEFRTGTGGVGSAPPFTLVCPDGSAVIGIEGRAGAGIDAVGIVCGQP